MQGPALPETPASSSTVLPSPFGFAPPPESETSQRSAQTTEAIDTPRPADTAQSGALLLLNYLISAYRLIPDEALGLGPFRSAPPLESETSQNSARTTDTPRSPLHSPVTRVPTHLNHQLPSKFVPRSADDLHTFLPFASFWFIIE